MNPPSMSIDLILQIMSRLPAKSVARFRCVSKLWASILGSPYFTELFLTISSSKPRLLFAIAEDGVWSFFSLSQLQNSYEKTLNIVVAAEFHLKLSPGDLRIYPCNDLRYFACAYASGLIYFYGQGMPLICNPNTGRYASLPFLHSFRNSYSLFGFEPIDKQYKVLFMKQPSSPGPPVHHKILTLGTGEMSCRKIKCSLRHDIKSEGVCINGVLYYLGDTSNCNNDAHDVTSDYVIVCFDFRSEKFTFIGVERFCRLVNYKGKLAVIFWEDDVYLDQNFVINWEDDVEDNVVDADTITELCVWVQEDVEKQEWLKYAYVWSDDKFFCRRRVSVVGVTACGEIVFSMRKYTSEQPFYVFYFSPERNTLRRVEIKGIGETFKKHRSVFTFVNHVEDLTANDLKLCRSMLHLRAQ